MSLADTTREQLERDIATALYGEGSYPFNDATGWTVKYEVMSVVEALAEKIIYRDRLERIHQIHCQESDGAPLIAHVTNEPLYRLRTP